MTPLVIRRSSRRAEILAQWSLSVHSLTSMEKERVDADAEETERVIEGKRERKNVCVSVKKHPEKCEDLLNSFHGWEEGYHKHPVLYWC